LAVPFIVFLLLSPGFLNPTKVYFLFGTKDDIQIDSQARTSCVSLCLAQVGLISENGTLGWIGNGTDNTVWQVPQGSLPGRLETNIDKPNEVQKRQIRPEIPKTSQSIIQQKRLYSDYKSIQKSRKKMEDVLNMKA